MPEVILLEDPFVANTLCIGFNVGFSESKLVSILLSLWIIGAIFSRFISILLKIKTSSGILFPSPFKVIFNLKIYLVGSNKGSYVKLPKPGLGFNLNSEEFSSSKIINLVEFPELFCWINSENKLLVSLGPVPLSSNISIPPALIWPILFPKVKILSFKSFISKVAAKIFWKSPLSL